MMQRKAKKQPSGALVFEPDVMLTKRFEAQQRMTDENLAKAEEKLVALRETYAQEIPEHIEMLYHDFLAFKMRTKEIARQASIKRQVLNFKGSAGMFGLPSISIICEMLIHLTDHAPDLSKPEIYRALNIYIQALHSLSSRNLLQSESKHTAKLIEEFEILNQHVLGGLDA